MKQISLICLLFTITLFTYRVNGHSRESRIQQFGQITPWSRIIEEREIQYARRAPHAQLTRSLHYPTIPNDDRIDNIIGAIMVVHNLNALSTNATLLRGGIGKRFVQISLTSAPGQRISTRIIIFAE